jgi:4-carboxymuconolactone decarboxylase
MEETMKSALWMSSLTIAAAGGWLAATMFAQPATGKQPRFPQLTMDALNEAQKPLGEQVMKVSSVGLGGPYNPLMRSPVLGQRLFDLFHYLRWETSVPTRLNEFAILIIGRQWRSQVEWYAHAPLAAKAGLSADIIAELKAGQRPSKMAEDEALVYDFVTELTTTQKVSDETFARAKKALQRSADRGFDWCGRQLRHGRDDAGNGGGNHAARQGAAVQGWREIIHVSDHLAASLPIRPRWVKPKPALYFRP